MKKIKVGDRVQLKAKSHSWHTNLIIELFTRPGENFFPKQHYEEIALLLGSKARRTKLKGRTTHYGSDGKCLYVEFKWKDLKCGFYCDQHDLKRL